MKRIKYFVIIIILSLSQPALSINKENFKPFVEIKGGYNTIVERIGVSGDITFMEGGGWRIWSFIY